MMSGGSFNYLCFAEANQLFQKMDDLARMRDALIDYPDAAKETESVILICKQFEILIQARMDRLHEVWRAVEWKRSGDTGQDGIEKAINDYRNPTGIR